MVSVTIITPKHCKKFYFYQIITPYNSYFQYFSFFSFSCTSPNKETPDQFANAEQETYYQYLYPDTWVATDVLGRTIGKEFLNVDALEILHTLPKEACQCFIVCG